MDEVERLRQQLRDEAAWRSFVEGQLQREVEKARVWQRRAEERSERIARLRAGQSLRQAVASRIARPAAPRSRIPDDALAVEIALRHLVETPPHRPAHPSVRAAVLATSAPVRALAAEFDGVDVDIDASAALRDADVVVVEATAWDAAPSDVARTVREALGGAARPPVLWFGGVPPALVDATTDRDLDVRTSPTTSAAPATAARVHVCPPWAAPVPSWSVPRPGSFGRLVQADGVDLITTKHGPAAAVVDDVHRALGLALAGTPVLTSRGTAAHGLPEATDDGSTDPIDLDELAAGGAVPGSLRRLGIRQRRAVAATATAGLRAGELLDAAHIDHATARARLSVLLSSNRPALVPGQLTVLGDQRRRPDEVVCAFHGGVDATTRAAAERAADRAGMELLVHTPDAAVPLGTVLNDLARAASGTLFAKIDDDDHYGPCHLLDAVDALVGTGADLVGRKAHYVHLTGPDRTWLLAESSEDEWTTQGIMGATFVWRRGLHDLLPFSPRPRRVDSLYVRAAAALGARMWAMPANDFAYVRNLAGGTNVAGQGFVTARGVDVGPGLPLETVDV